MVTPQALHKTLLFELLLANQYHGSGSLFHPVPTEGTPCEYNPIPISRYENPNWSRRGHSAFSANWRRIIESFAQGRIERHFGQSFHDTLVP